MIQREVGGLQNEPTSSFSELSHLKALICKMARLPWLPTPYTPNNWLHSLGHCLKVTLTTLKRFMKETAANK